MRIGLLDINIMHGTEFATILRQKARPEFEDVQVTHWYSVADETRIRGTFYPGDRPIIPPAEYANRLGIARAVERPEDMIGGIDAAIICSRFGDDNLAAARPFLEAGIPTFLDKPAAYTLEDTRTMLSLVRSKGMPFLCSSLWKFTPAVQGMLQQMAPLGDIRTAICTGPGHDELFFYGTHSVETVQWLLGHGVESVSCHADDLRYAILIRMADGRIGFANAIRKTTVLRHIVVYCERGFTETTIDEPQRHAGSVNILVQFMRMLRGEIESYPLDLIEEATATLVAAQRSASEDGRWVSLAEIGYSQTGTGPTA